MMMMGKASNQTDYIFNSLKLNKSFFCALQLCNQKTLSLHLTKHPNSLPPCYLIKKYHNNEDNNKNNEIIRASLIRWILFALANYQIEI